MVTTLKAFPISTRQSLVDAFQYHLDVDWTSSKTYQHFQRISKKLQLLYRADRRQPVAPGTESNVLKLKRTNGTTDQTSTYSAIDY